MARGQEGGLSSAPCSCSPGGAGWAPPVEAKPHHPATLGQGLDVDTNEHLDPNFKNSQITVGKSYQEN